MTPGLSPEERARLSDLCDSYAAAFRELSDVVLAGKEPPGPADVKLAWRFDDICQYVSGLLAARGEDTARLSHQGEGTDGR